MSGKTRRGLRKDTRKLADIFRLLPAKRVDHLTGLMDYYRNHEQDFNLDGFIIGVKFDISEHAPADGFGEFRRILGVRDSHGTKLRTLALLSDALRVAKREIAAGKEAAPPDDGLRAETVPDLNDPMTKCILSGM